MVLYVDHEVKAKYVSDGYEPGSQTGRAWVWSATTHKIICAGEFSGTTPDKVSAKVYAGEDSSSEMDIAMTLALARASERSALTNLVAAGPPPSR